MSVARPSVVADRAFHQAFHQGTRSPWCPLSVLAVMGLVLVATGCSLAAAGSSDGEPGDGALAEVAVGDESEGGGAGDALKVSADTIPTRPEVVIPATWDSEIEEVYGRYWLYWEAFAAAHAPPNADPTFEPLESLSTAANWASLQQELEAFAEDGLVLVLPGDSITEHLIRIPNAAVLVKEEGAEVVLQDCWIDDFVQQTVEGRVLAETEDAKLMNVTMRVVNGQWRVDGVTRATAESDGFEQCVTLVSK